MLLQHGELDIGLQSDGPALRVLVHECLQTQSRAGLKSERPLVVSRFQTDKDERDEKTQENRHCSGARQTNAKQTSDDEHHGVSGYTRATV